MSLPLDPKTRGPGFSQPRWDSLAKAYKILRLTPLDEYIQAQYQANRAAGQDPFRHLGGFTWLTVRLAIELQFKDVFLFMSQGDCKTAEDLIAHVTENTHRVYGNVVRHSKSSKKKGRDGVTIWVVKMAYHTLHLRYYPEMSWTLPPAVDGADVISFPEWLHRVQRRAIGNPYSMARFCQVEGPRAYFYAEEEEFLFETSVDEAVALGDKFSFQFLSAPSPQK